MRTLIKQIGIWGLAASTVAGLTQGPGVGLAVLVSCYVFGVVVTGVWLAFAE